MISGASRLTGLVVLYTIIGVVLGVFIGEHETKGPPETTTENSPAVNDEWLQSRYALNNALYFENKLPKDTIVRFDPKLASMNYLGIAIPNETPEDCLGIDGTATIDCIRGSLSLRLPVKPNDPGHVYIIEISSKVYATKHIEFVLDHEMMHVAGFWGHGDDFQAGMLSIAKKGAFKEIW